MTEKEYNTGTFIYRMYLLHCKKSIGFVAIYSVCTLVVFPHQLQVPLHTGYTGLESHPMPLPVTRGISKIEIIENLAN